MLHIVTYHKGICPGIAQPLTMGLIKTGEQSSRYADGQCLAFTRTQFACLCKGFQFFGGFVISTLRSSYIYLCHLLATYLTCILHRNTHLYLVFLLTALHIVHVERGVTQSKTEWISHGLLIGIEITITYVDSFVMICIIHTTHTVVIQFVSEIIIIRRLREIVSRRMVSGSNRPCHREVTGRIGFAREYISDAVATFFTWLPCHEDSIGTVAPGGCLHHTSGVNDYDNWFISCMESI